MLNQTTTIHAASKKGYSIRIGPKIIAGYLLLILLMAGVAGVAYWGMTRITAADQTALKRQADIAQVWAMLMYMDNQYGSQADLIINNDPAEIDEFRAAIKKMDEKKELVRKAVDTDEERQWMADIDQLDDQFDSLFFEQIVPAQKAGNQELLKTIDDQSDEVLAQMESKAHLLIASFENEVIEDRTLAEKTYRQTILLMAGVSVVAAIAGLVFGFFLSRSISNPVQVVTQAAQQLAEQDLPRLVRAIQAVAEGDLTATVQLRPNIINVQSGDEVGQMAGAFNNMNQAMAVMGENFAKMLVNLRALISRTQQSAMQVASASRQLNASADQAGQASQQVATTTQQIAAGTTQQTQSITEATDNTEQMSRAAEGIARGAQEQAAGMQKVSDLISETAKLVEQAGQAAGAVTGANTKVSRAARHGVTAVEQTSKGMDTIRTRATVTARKVKEMGNRSKEIGRIVETIDDIADKTDMLALNAAVEAARAGEHGRGFAVVADQVRKLSEDSKGATRDIDDLIERVQETINEAIAAMESTVAEVDNGAQLTKDTAQSLQDILQAADEAAEMAEQISDTVTQLKQKSEGVVSANEAVSAVIEENTAVSEEMAANSQEVTEAMEGIAGIAEENSAATEEVSASAEEMAAQVEEVVASAEELSALAEELHAATAQFRVNEAARTGWKPPESSPEIVAIPANSQPAQTAPIQAGHQSNGHSAESP